MTAKRKTLLIVLAAVVVVLVAAAVFLAMGLGSGSTASEYSDTLTRGEKYLDEEDYENAVLCYTRAIDLDPDDEAGYIGLATAYIGQGDLSDALDTLNEGYGITGSIRIFNLRLDEFPDGVVPSDPGEDTIQWGSWPDVSPTPTVVAQPEDDETVEGQLALNTALLNTIVRYAYDDYRMDGYIVSESAFGDIYSVSVDIDSVGAQLLFYNTDKNSHIIDANTNKPYSTCMPNSVTLANLESLLGTDTTSYGELSSLGLSSLSLTEDGAYGWTVSFLYHGCEIILGSDEEGNITPGSLNRLIPPESPVVVTGDQELFGRVIDDAHGNGVSGAELSIRSVNGGEPVTVVSETGGYYSVDLEEGGYTVTVSCAGYVEKVFSVTVSGSTTEENFVISPDSGAELIRIVLEWGSYPTDLDSHLKGTTDSGRTVNISYTNMQAWDSSGNVVAELSTDVTTGYGPEITTIYDMDGTYTFYVVDFTRSGALSGSGATVRIYVGDDSPVTIPVRSGLENGWLVCRIDHGNVEVVNAAVDESEAY